MKAIAYAVFKGMQAHIDEDLPHALAQVYTQHYASLCRYERFRADYLLMGPVFERASQRFIDELPTSSLTLRARLMRAALPPAVSTHILRGGGRLFAQRCRAFESGARIAKTLAGSVDDDTAS